LRRYAEAVGESAAQLQELYAGTSATSAPDLTRIPRAGPVSRSSPLLLPALLLVVGVALIGVFWWLLNLPHATSRPLEGAPPAAAGGAEADDRSPGPGGTTPTGGQRAPAGSLPATSTGQAELGVRFSALSWVEISDAEGRRLLEGLYARGSVRQVRGTAPLRVVLGNAPAVDLELNGQPVPLTGLVHRNGSAYLSIDGGGHVSAAAPRLAHGD
jgi:cytoskeletal protein RodZ